MRAVFKKIMVLTMTVALCVSCYKPMEAKAWEYPLTESAGPWVVSDGVTASISKGVLTITGNGVIPDYNGNELNKRPWHTSIVAAIQIGPGITDIGRYAFFEMKRVENVQFSSTTFIADGTSIDRLSNQAQFRITGSDVATRMIGTIPYTSTMSQVAQIQGYANYAFIVDPNTGMRGTMMKMVYPYPANIYDANAADAIKDRNAHLPADTYTTPIRFSPDNGIRLYATRRVQGYYGLLHFSNFIGEYSYGTSYSLEMLSSIGLPIKKDMGVCTFVLTVPEDLRKAGRQYRIICLVDNKTAQTLVIDDMDNNVDTVTFQAPMGVTYALCYKDA